jgi:hypothetical protein
LARHQAEIDAVESDADEGIITETEYESKKVEILAGM